MLVHNIYIGIFIYSLVSFIIVLILYTLSYLLSNKFNYMQKLSIYECGFEPLNNSQTKFNIKFYLVAVLFIIFDLEIIFLFPWSISLMVIGTYGYYAIMYFCFILTIGFIYEYRCGALDW